jgi:hypothetical protein
VHTISEPCLGYRLPYGCVEVIRISWQFLTTPVMMMETQYVSETLDHYTAVTLLIHREHIIEFITFISFPSFLHISFYNPLIFLGSTQLLTE